MEEPTSDISPLTTCTRMLQAAGADEPGHLMIATGTHIDHPLMDGTMCLAMSRLTREDGSLCYSEVFHLKLSSQTARKLPPDVHRVTSEAATLASVMALLDTIPEGGAVFIREASEIWAGRDESPARITMSTLTGETMRVQSLNERATFTLSKVIPDLIKIAHNRKLLLVSVCSLPHNVWEGLPDQIKSMDDLTFFAERSDDVYSPLEEALGAGLADLQSGKKTLEEVKAEFERLAPDEYSRRQAFAQALSCAGLHHAAWEEISPALPKLESCPVSLLVRIAKMALDALDAKSCQHWIALARIKGVVALQDWMTVLQLARATGDQSLEFLLLEEMAIHFPDHEVALIGKLRSKVAEGDAVEASFVANQLGRPGLGAAMEVIARGGSIPEVVRVTTNDDDRGLALMTMSIVADMKRNYSLAWEAARRIPAGAAQQSYALGLRWRIWAKRTMERDEDPSAPGRPNHKDVARLEELVSDTLALSRDTSVRYAMEEACHETLTPTIFQTACVRLLIAELKNLRSDVEDKPWNLVIATDGDQAEPAQQAAFFAALKQPRAKKFIVLGKGELPPEALKQATPEMARLLVHTLQNPVAHETDEDIRLLLVQLIEMICRFLGDPSLDSMAGLLLVRATARRQDGQTARNYAEEMLRALPDTQPEYHQWRLGLAWLAMAESLLGSNSAQNALLPMLLGVKAMRGQVVDAMLVVDALNMGARILRDLKDAQAAKELIALEKEILEEHDQSFLLQRNRHFGLMLRLSSLSVSRPDGIQAFMHEVLTELRTLEPSDDRMPLLTLVANCVRFLRLAGQEIDSTLTGELVGIMDASEKNASNHSQVVRSMLLGKFTVEWFVGQLTKASRAVRSEDADAQFRSIQIVAADAFAQAIADNEPSLALAVSAAVSQPALLSRQSARSTVSDRAVRLFREQLASKATNMDDAQVKDQLEALASRGNPRLVDLDWTNAGSVERVQQLLAPNEMLIAICVLGDHLLGILKIGREGVAEVTALPPSVWKEESWLMVSTHISAMLSPDHLNRRLQEIRNSSWFKISPEIDHVIVVPETRLFGWPLNVAAKSFGAHGERLLGLTVAPSIAWFAQARKSELSASKRQIFWIGQGIHNEPLLAANLGVPPLAVANGLTQIPNLDRQCVGKASLALLVTHGEMTADGELSGLSDETHNWDPEDVGSILAECECVILGCCNAGSSETPTSSNESWSLVASILSYDVRCVIAPVWSISVDFLIRWLGDFFQALAEKVSIADAVATANLRAAKDNKELYSMQVYGDGSIGGGIS